MHHRYHMETDAYDSNDLFSPESTLFDSTGDILDAETAATKIDSFNEVDCQVDVEDLPNLLCGAAHPPEYYRQIAKDINDIDFDKQDYSPGTEILLNVVESHWRR